MNFLLIGKPGCLSEDTQIRIQSGKNGGRDYNLKTAYKKIHKYPGCRKTFNQYLIKKCISLIDDGYISYNEIEDIIHSGIKDVFAIQTNAFYLEATKDHLFKTPNDGYVKLDDLKPKDKVLCRYPFKEKTGKQNNRPEIVYSIPYHPYAWIYLVNEDNYKRLPRAKIIYEAWMNDLSENAFIKILRKNAFIASTLKYLSKDAVVHHRNNNPFDQDPSNFKVFESRSEHDKYHGDTTRFNFTDQPTFVQQIISITPKGEKDTYDLCMKAPNHNFVAHNFIVHNSGKTTAACTGHHPTALIDVDGKAHEMRNIQPLIKSGDVTIISVKAKLVEDRLAYRAEFPNKGPKTMPKGYIETVEMLNDAIDNTNGFEKYNTVVLDSLTRLVEHMKRLLVYHRTQKLFGKFDEKKASDDLNWPSWGSYLSNLEEIFSAIAGYMETDFICCAHTREQIVKDEITNSEYVEAYWPMVDGQMREKLAGYFNEVYYLDPEEKVGKPINYRFRTRGKKYCARTSLPLPEFTETNISKILST